MRRFIIIFLCCFLSLCNMHAFAQSDGSSAGSDSASSGIDAVSGAASAEASGAATPSMILDERPAAAKPPKSANPEDDTPINFAPSTKKATAPKNEINPFMQFLKMLPSLALVLLLAYIAMLGLQRFQQGGMRGVLAGISGQAKSQSRLIKVLENTQLAPGRFLYVVAVGGRVYLLGVTAQTMEVLGEVTGDDLVAIKLRGEDEAPQVAPEATQQLVTNSLPATMNSFIARMFSSNSPRAAAPPAQHDAPSQTETFLEQLEKARKSINDRKEGGQ